MKLKTKRILLLLLLLAGILWDCLCLFQMVPRGLFSVSAAVIGGYCLLIIFVPLLFPGIAKAREKSGYLPNLTKSEKQMSYAAITLALVWLFTLIACIVYPL